MSSQLEHGGTDHGTVAVAFVLGGAVAGRKVRADWPGLNDLLENRDLAPTTDLRPVARGPMGQRLGLEATALASVFPGSAQVVNMADVNMADVNMADRVASA